MTANGDRGLLRRFNALTEWQFWGESTHPAAVARFARGRD
jgi:hypothetical protein